MILDFAEKSLTFGGVDRFDIVDYSATGWWNLGIGNNTVTVDRAGISISWRDAYK